MKKLFYIIIPLFILAFTFTGGPPQGWYQQFLPSLSGGQVVSDIIFLDSLTGFIVTDNSTINDTSSVLKTTNGGDNWQIVYTAIDDFSTIAFTDMNTGFICGGDLYKSTNGGNSWFTINRPNQTKMEDMFVLNKDTFWVVDSDGLTGGVFRTTNGGVNWTQQLNIGSLNPEKIYMHNGDIGFVGLDGGQRYIRKTTDGGSSWNAIVTNDYFNDIYFTDSLTGWKCSVFGMKKTTNGGINWVTQTLPSGGIISVSGIHNFSNINTDTIWGAGGYVIYPNNEVRGLLYRTTNGGDNWFAQVPDTSIKVFASFMQFIDKDIGWAYDNSPTGIHTTTGGDTTFISSINSISTEVPTNYILHQNYPNPFNPYTKIRYDIRKSSQVRLVIFDITGKVTGEMVNQRQNPGTYEYTLDGKNLSSGVYFYRLQTEDFIDTKKMMLIK